MSTTTRCTARILKHCAVGMAAVVLLLISYVAGAPVVAGVVQSRFPAADPIAQVFYSPLIYYAQHSELPGSEFFASYASEVQTQTVDAMR